MSSENPAKVKRIVRDRGLFVTVASRRRQQRESERRMPGDVSSSLRALSVLLLV